jgi:type II secretory pathway pseudopilin PulG
MLELIVVVAAIAILAAILSPMVLKVIDDSRVSRAQNECVSIATAVAALYKDTGMWPYTNANGPSGSVDRLVTASTVPTAIATGAGSGAANWGTYGTSKHLGDFLYWNNPDDNSTASGNGANQNNQDYPTTGQGAWRGPYVDRYDIEDPWGNAYVINVRYLPGGRYTGTVRHKVIVLSAGPDGRWSTPYSDAVTETVMGDDIGHVVHVLN